MLLTFRVLGNISVNMVSNNVMLKIFFISSSNFRFFFFWSNWFQVRWFLATVCSAKNRIDFKLQVSSHLPLPITMGVLCLSMVLHTWIGTCSSIWSQRKLLLSDLLRKHGIKASFGVNTLKTVGEKTSHKSTIWWPYLCTNFLKKSVSLPLYKLVWGRPHTARCRPGTASLGEHRCTPPQVPGGRLVDGDDR